LVGVAVNYVDSIIYAIAFKGEGGLKAMQAILSTTNKKPLTVIDTIRTAMHSRRIAYLCRGLQAQRYIQLRFAICAYQYSYGETYVFHHDVAAILLLSYLQRGPSLLSN
jgi:hypothetical protein